MSSADPSASATGGGEPVVTRQQIALAHDITIARLHLRMDAPAPLSAFLADLNHIVSSERPS